MDDRARASGATGPVDPAKDIAERLAKLRGLSVREPNRLQIAVHTQCLRVCEGQNDVVRGIESPFLMLKAPGMLRKHKSLLQELK